MAAGSKHPSPGFAQLAGRAAEEQPDLRGAFQPAPELLSVERHERKISDRPGAALLETIGLASEAHPLLDPGSRAS
jgi:hypothetical protein